MENTTSIIPAATTITHNEDHSGAISDEHLVGLWLSQKSVNTRAAYMADTAKFMAHLRVRGLGIRQATLADIQGYVDTIEGAPATKARRVSSMKSLLSFAYRTGYVAFNVGKAIVVPKVPNDLAERILTEEQVIRMISVVKPGRDQVLIRLLYVSGLRVSEVEGLRWKHVHLGDGEARLTVHGKGGKTRHILLTATVTQQLEALRGDDYKDDDAVFLSRTRKPLRKRDIRRVVAKVAKTAGLKQAVSPHWMRHAHASHALDRGAPIHLVQQDLGHASLTTTSRYVHANPADGSARYLLA